MGWGSQIAAANINGKPAAVLGYGPGQGAGTTPLHVVVMDLTHANNPVAIGDVAIRCIARHLWRPRPQNDRVHIGGDTRLQ
jgi:hypothetical protein